MATRTRTLVQKTLHCGTKETKKLLCRATIYDKDSSWMDGNIEAYASQWNENNGAFYRSKNYLLVPCQKCVENPEYPLHVLNGEKL